MSRVRTAVALLIFNRPQLTRRVVETVRAAQPPVLLVVADGPRHPDESSRCAEARAAVLEAVDWPCDVRTNFADANLGCRTRVSSGLDWVFDQVPEAIILEDDCVPVPTFFDYCDALLERYRDDERVMHIGGVNFVPEGWHSTASYRYSRNVHVWGWASWRSAWHHYDVEMECWPEFVGAGMLEAVTGSRSEASFYRSVYDQVRAGAIDTWDYQWQFACWSQSGLATVPRVNLVQNIGFGEDGTHTTGESPLAGMPTNDLGELEHPRLVARDVLADRAVFRLETGLSDEVGPLAKMDRRLHTAVARLRRR